MPQNQRNRLSLPLVLALAAAALLAFWLYAPWQQRGFAVVDFSEFLPLLRERTGFFDRLAGLVEYYVGEHGRFNVLSYFALAAKWELLGERAVLWQLLRFVELLGLAVGTLWMLRRLGASRAGAAVGAGLFFFSYSAALAYVRLTMGEPLGYACMLLALDAVLRSRETGTRGQQLAAAFWFALAILAKEMYAVWWPVLVLIGAGVRVGPSRNGETGLRLDRPALRLAAGLAVAGVLAVGAVLLAARQSAATGYAADYALWRIDPARLFQFGERVLFPWPVQVRTDVLIMQLAALSWAGVILLGYARLWRQRASSALWLGSLAVGLGLGFAAPGLYLPWPVYLPFYGLAFLFGPAWLIAAALTALGEADAKAGRAAAAAAVLALVLTVPHAARLARTAAAGQEIRTRVAHELGRLPAVDTLFVAEFPAVQRWQGMAATLERFARSERPPAPIPPIRELPCAAAVALLDRGLGRSALLSLSDTCGGIPGAARSLQVSFPTFSWSELRWGRETIEADFALPP